MLQALAAVALLLLPKTNRSIVEVFKKNTPFSCRIYHNAAQYHASSTSYGDERDGGLTRT